jgi:hypothetical protein
MSDRRWRGFTGRSCALSGRLRLRSVRRERLSLKSTVDREDLARELLRARARPVAWCVLDWASEATAKLTDVLLATWGAGLCYLPGVPWADEARRAVLSKTAASRMLRASRTRVWWSESDLPDPARVMESLEHGCLPLQFTQVARHDGDGELSEPLRALLLRADRPGSVAAFGHEELTSRIDTVATALANNQLERDLSDLHG